MNKHQQFDIWLKKLKDIWEKKEPLKIIDLCAEKFLWFETPFSKPYSTKEQLLKDWQGILSQKNIIFTYEILCTNKQMGIIHWSVQFVRTSSEEKVSLDGIFQVILNEQGKFKEFHQWYSVNK